MIVVLIPTDGHIEESELFQGNSFEDLKDAISKRYGVEKFDDIPEEYDKEIINRMFDDFKRTNESYFLDLGISNYDAKIWK